MCIVDVNSNPKKEYGQTGWFKEHKEVIMVTQLRITIGVVNLIEVIM